VPWLGFIERTKARAPQGAQPVRLVQITRIGRRDSLSIQWQDVPAGQYVHGCLVPAGAYAVYQRVVCQVGKPPASKVSHENNAAQGVDVRS
jgi:hypothetical protein